MIVIGLVSFGCIMVYSCITTYYVDLPIDLIPLIDDYQRIYPDHYYQVICHNPFHRAIQYRIYRGKSYIGVWILFEWKVLSDWNDEDLYEPLQTCLHIGTACPLLLHLGTNCEHKNRGNNV